MKNFIHQVQNLTQKAAQLKQAVQSAPAKAAEIREAVAATAGQLHQLRADVQSSVNSLRTEGEDRLTQALREIDDSTGIFHEAGYAVSEVEMELGLAQRLIVQLEKFEDVPHATLHSLLNANQGLKTVHAILAALLKAEELADNVRLHNLTFHKLTVYAGMTPSVRICWGAASEEEIPAAAPVARTAVPSTPVSSFSQSTFFERRPAGPAATVTQAAMPAAVEGVASAAAAPVRVAGTPAPVPGGTPVRDWRQGVLDRFKKMPDLNKPSH